MKTAKMLMHAALVVVVATLAAAVAVAAPAQAAPTKTQCVTVISKPGPGQATSAIVSHSCAEVPADQQQLPAMPMGGTLLVTFYEDIDYGGSESLIYGDSGTCDSSGYGISDMSGVQAETGGVSSYRLFGACTISEKFSGVLFTGTSSGLIWGQNQPWVGAQWNDGGIRSFWVLTDA